MSGQRQVGIALCFAWVLSLGAAVRGLAEAPRIEFEPRADSLEITVGGRPLAEYVYRDAAISRPYFAHVHAPGGVQVTRRHPPVEGRDKADHATFHPGLWMAFGDISGHDYWRLDAPVTHEGFVEPPTVGAGTGSFAVENAYRRGAGDSHRVVCRERCRYTIAVRPAGLLLTWDSTFTGDEPFRFGDQEEMGLGIRVATPLRVETGDGSLPPGNGTIIDAQGRKNGAEVGGNAADWCDYRGTLSGRRVGIAIFCHPENFRPSWFHARDYGFLAANPFGRAAFDQGPPSTVVAGPEEPLRLRYGILLHSGPPGSSPDLDAAYADYVRQAGR